LKLEYDKLLSSVAFNLSLRRYNEVNVIESARLADEVGRCRFTVSKPVLKAPTVSALEAEI
jgi:hypothetical protein